jgi:hypothetical protein
MATSYKLLVIQAEYGITCVQKIWMENDLNAIRWRIEEFDASYLVQNRVTSIIRHIMCCDRWQRGALESKSASLEQHLIFFGEQ